MSTVLSIQMVIITHFVGKEAKLKVETLLAETQQQLVEKNSLLEKMKIQYDEVYL
jgi:hypothetical protein